MKPDSRRNRGSSDGCEDSKKKEAAAASSSCYDLSKLSEALDMAVETKPTTNAVVNVHNSVGQQIDGDSTFDLSKMAEALSVAEKTEKRFSSFKLRVMKEECFRRRRRRPGLCLSRPNMFSMFREEFIELEQKRVAENKEEEEEEEWGLEAEEKCESEQGTQPKKRYPILYRLSRIVAYGHHPARRIRLKHTSRIRQIF